MFYVLADAIKACLTQKVKLAINDSMLETQMVPHYNSQLRKTIFAWVFKTMSNEIRFFQDVKSKLDQSLISIKITISHVCFFVERQNIVENYD